MSKHHYLGFGKMNLKKLIQKKKDSGTRKYTPKDLEIIQLIYHLVKEKGMTLGGAKRQLKEKNGILAHKDILIKLEKIKLELKQISDQI